MIQPFPEVYHAHRITTPVFSGPARRVTGQGMDTTYSVVISCYYRYILCLLGGRAGAVQSDPVQPEIGSARRETGRGYDDITTTVKSYLM
ncbi:hypothetical protein EIL26_17200 [Salmonella enterica subsp. enterica serovar Newport]|nr:hypothetical protein [Salmonella enterica subsp. enterica serovar Newport]